MATDNELLDSETHEKYLDLITNKLDAILRVLQGLRDDVQNLPRDIAREIR